MATELNPARLSDWPDPATTKHEGPCGSSLVETVSVRIRWRPSGDGGRLEIDERDAPAEAPKPWIPLAPLVAPSGGLAWSDLDQTTKEQIEALYPGWRIDELVAVRWVRTSGPPIDPS